MAVEERSRRSLYDLSKEPLGMAATNALLDELPPLGADLATKDDIDAFRREMDHRFDGVYLRFDAFESRFVSLESQFESRFVSLESQFESRFESRFGAMESRFTAVDSRFDVMEARISEQIGDLREELSRRMLVAFLAMFGLVVTLIVGLVVPLSLMT